MYNHFLTVFPLLLLFTIPGKCVIDIEVQLYSYSNPSNRDSDYTPCVNGNCSNEFQFCMRPRYTSDCRYGQVTTNVTTRNSFSSTPVVLSELGIMNPLLFSNFTPQDVVELVITVTQRDNSTMLVDRFKVPFSRNLTITDQFSETVYVHGIYRNALIMLSYRITSKCSNSTYGPNCSRICETQRSYYCNYLGVRICNSGYYPAGVCSQYCDTNCDESGGGTFSTSYPVIVVIGVLSTLFIVCCISCWVICCIICCVHEPSRIKLKDLCNEKDREDCSKCTHTQVRCLAGALLWIVLLPISCPYCIITSMWNQACDAQKKDDEFYCEPMPCCSKYHPCHPYGP